MVQLPHDDLPLPLPRGRALPAGCSSFDLELGTSRLRLLDLPVDAEPFVAHHYGAFAQVASPEKHTDLVVRCRFEEGLFEALPEPGGETVLNVAREKGRRYRIRSHWQHGWIDLDAHEGELVLGDRRVERFSMSVENFLRVALQLLVIDAGAFLFHGAGILDQGRVFLFFGPSGAGKSTATAFSAPRAALSDDMVLLDAERGLACTVPFFMKFPPAKRVRGWHPVAAALRLRQAAHDALDPVGGARAVATLSASVPYVHEMGLGHEGLTALIARLAERVPLFDLFFTKSARFWDLLDARFPALR